VKKERKGEMRMLPGRKTKSNHKKRKTNFTGVPEFPSSEGGTKPGTKKNRNCTNNRKGG